MSPKKHQHLMETAGQPKVSLVPRILLPIGSPVQIRAGSLCCSVISTFWEPSSWFTLFPCFSLGRRPEHHPILRAKHPRTPPHVTAHHVMLRFVKIPQTCKFCSIIAANIHQRGECLFICLIPNNVFCCGNILLVSLRFNLASDQSSLCFEANSAGFECLASHSRYLFVDLVPIQPVGCVIF